MAVLLILGAGPRVGAAVAETFAAQGYRIALASRKGDGKKNDKGYLTLSADLSKPETIPSLWDAIKAEYNEAPSVVVYNAGSLTPPPVKDDPLSIAASDVTKDLITNTVSPYVAAHEAVEGWEGLSGKKSFIYTGNICNVQIVPMPLMVNVGMGKSASAYWLGTADHAYAGRGYRFFYADERHADGRLKGFDLDGAAHGEFFLQLAQHEGTVPWHATFVKGAGYAKF